MKDLSRHITKEDTIVNGHMERYTLSDVTAFREMPGQSTVRYWPVSLNWGS